MFISLPQTNKNKSRFDLSTSRTFLWESSEPEAGGMACVKRVPLTGGYELPGSEGLRSPYSLSPPVTPSPSSSFTDEDERAIQHCFHYTGTVLTSTLAFQKEQKLKCECQVSACLELFLRTSSSPRSLPTRVMLPVLSRPVAALQLGNLVTWKSLKEGGQ